MELSKAKEILQEMNVKGIITKIPSDEKIQEELDKVKAKYIRLKDVMDRGELLALAREKLDTDAARGYFLKQMLLDKVEEIKKNKSKRKVGVLTMQELAAGKRVETWDRRKEIYLMQLSD